MATELGVAYLSILPETSKIAPGITKAMGGASKGAERAGKDVATRFGFGLNGAIGGIVSRSAGIFAAGFASIKVGGFLKDAISQASDLGETTSKVGQIFGPAAKEIIRFSKTSASALGQTQQAALDANATFGIFGKSAGLQGKELTGFTTRLTTLAGDLASFNNTSPEQAIEAIGAALRGETEPIRAYGVLLDDASLRQEALAQGLIKTTKNALTPQQKVLAAQSLILKQTTTAQGDFARTSGGLANQQRILSAQFNNFKTSIGAVALPLVTRLFGFLNAKAVPALSTLVLGIKATGAAFSGEGITSDGFVGFMERIGVTARAAAGIFQAQVIPRLKEFGGFVAATAVPAVRNLITAFTPLAKDVGSGAVSVFQKLLPVVKDLGSFVGGTVVPAIKNFTGFLKDNQTLVGSLAIGIGAMVVAFKAYQGVMAIVAIATKAWAVVQAALNVVLAANPIGIIVLAIAGLVAGLIYAYKNSETFRNIVNGVFNSVKGVVLGVVGALVTAFHAVVDAVTWVINGVRSVWSTIVVAVSGPINAIIGFLKAVWARVYPIIALPVFIAISLIKGYWQLISAAFTAAKNWVVGVFSRAWAAVSGVLSGPVNAAKSRLDSIWSLIKTGFNAVKNWVVGAFAKAWGGLTAKLTGPVNTARTAIGTILGAAKGGVQWVFSQAVTAIGHIWTGLQELAKKPIRFIIGTVLNDGLIGGFNWIAGKFDAPKIPTIPMPKGFAAGGRIPGAPSAVDNTWGSHNGRAIPLASGEFIVNARQTAKNLPLLKAINSGEEGFADGGLFGNLKSAVSSAYGLGKNLVGDAADFTKNPADWLKKRFSGPLGKLGELGDSAISQIVTKPPRKIADVLVGKAKSLLGSLFGAGPSGPPGARQSFRGVTLNQRTIAMLLNAERALGKTFSITQGSYSTSVAASGSTHAGGGAMDTNDAGAGWLRAQNALRAAGFAAWWRHPWQGPWNDHIHSIALGDSSASASAKAQMASFKRGGDGLGGMASGGLVRPNVLSFDNGGLLPTGYSMVHNGTGSPEPVGHDVLRASDLNGMRIVLDTGDVTLTGHIRITAQDEIRQSNKALKRRVGMGV